eukprot:4355141-Prymnesium_polylepis.1
MEAVVVVRRRWVRHRPVRAVRRAPRRRWRRARLLRPRTRTRQVWTLHALRAAARARGKSGPCTPSEHAAHSTRNPLAPGPAPGPSEPHPQPSALTLPLAFNPILTPSPPRRAVATAGGPGPHRPRRRPHPKR